MFEKFPYTNLHELNLDWIIKITQDFLEQYTSIQQVISDGEASLNEIIANGDSSLHEIIATGENSIAQLTVTKIQELNAEKNRLEALLQAWYDTHSQDIASQLATALADMTIHYNGLVSALNTLNSQIRADVQQKGVDTLATIPSDYTTLYNNVVDLKSAIIISADYTNGFNLFSLYQDEAYMNPDGVSSVSAYSIYKYTPNAKTRLYIRNTPNALSYVDSIVIPNVGNYRTRDQGTTWTTIPRTPDNAIVIPANYDIYINIVRGQESIIISNNYVQIGPETVSLADSLPLTSQMRSQVSDMLETPPYGGIVSVENLGIPLNRDDALHTYMGYVTSSGELVEQSSYNTYMFYFPNGASIYTTDEIATGETPYLSYGVFRDSTIQTSNLITWVRNQNSQTTMPTRNNPLVINPGEYLAITVTSTSLYTYFNETKRTLKSDIIIENVLHTSKIKYHDLNGLYIAEKVNAGYIVYDFNRYTSADTNADGWGIARAYLYNDDMEPITNISTSGEWECAVHLVNRPDFSGLRAHGSEVYTDIKFIIDGNYYTEQTIQQIEDWMQFDSIIIYETSKLYDPNDEVTEIANHWKKYIWKNNELIIEQKLQWLINDQTTSCYLAMFPCAKSVTNYFVDNSNFVFLDISSGSPSYNANGCKSITLFSTGGQTADVCATFETGEYNAGGTNYTGFSLTDNGGGAYNKCYYHIGTNKIITNGEVWKSKSIYKWQV